MQIIDGQEYTDDQTPPDLGSIECISILTGVIRIYRGLSEDFDKMKEYAKIVKLSTGSRIRFVDTGKTFKYFAPSQEWYPCSDDSGGSSSSSGTSGVTYTVIGEHLYIN